MNWNEFKNNVERWAEERGIYKHSTPEAQLLKALSELGELADAVIKNDREAMKDAIGDLAVCWINYAKMGGHETGFPCFDPGEPVSAQTLIGSVTILTGRLLEGTIHSNDVIVMLCTLVGIAQRKGFVFLDCCAAAWDEIKDRKGRMVPGGAFVKEDDFPKPLKQINPEKVVRDKNGFWTHSVLKKEHGKSDLIHNSWFERSGIEIKELFFSLDASEDILDKRDPRGDYVNIFPLWNPTKPEGEGWFILSIHDTEDSGPVCWWARKIDESK